jgi:hypothetical protein
VPTWYSTMASLRSSARSDAAITSPSFSSLVLGCSDMRCNFLLIPSRALRSGQHGRSLQRMENTHSNKLARRLSSSASPEAPPSTTSRSSRARTDSILFVAGDVYGRVIRRHGPSMRCLTRCSFKSASKDTLDDGSPVELRNWRWEA